MKSVAPASFARSLLPGSSLPEITTTGNSRMRGSVAARMRPIRPKPVSLGMSRSVSTITIPGSLSMAAQPASPSASSRTANDGRRIETKVVRTNFESSTTSTHLCARSVDGGTLLLRQVDDDSPAHLGVDEVVEHAGELRQRNGAAHLLEERRLEIRGKALPHHVADVLRALARVDAEQARAAQDERHHRGIESRARRKADGGDDAIVLHGARHPRQHLAAKIVHRAGPGRLVERLDLLQVQALAQHDLLCPQFLQPVRFALLAGQRDHVIAAFGEYRECDR